MIGIFLISDDILPLAIEWIKSECTGVGLYAELNADKPKIPDMKYVNFTEFLDNIDSLISSPQCNYLIIPYHKSHQRKVSGFLGKLPDDAFVIGIVNDLTEKIQLPGKIVSLPASKIFNETIGARLNLVKRQRKIARMLDTVKENEKVLILTHNEPDPDSIASAYALAYLLRARKVTITIGYGGNLKRAENVRMIDTLELTLSNHDELYFDDFDHIALVDTQPGGNNSLPKEITPSIVIDHHSFQPRVGDEYRDIRQWFGATSTILAVYLKDSDRPIRKNIATELYYGIKTDCGYRDITIYDLEAMAFLYRKADEELLEKLQEPLMSMESLVAYQKALENRIIIDGVIFSHLGKFQAIEELARVADFFIQTRDISWSVVSCENEGNFYISIRCHEGEKNAGSIANRAYGKYGRAGGRHSAAGAQISKKRLKEAGVNYRSSKLVGEFILNQLLEVLNKR